MSVHLALVFEMHTTGLPQTCQWAAMSSMFRLCKASRSLVMPTLQDAWAGLHEDPEVQFKSAILRDMAAGGAFVDMQDPLSELLGFTDWDQAAERGRIVPCPGSDASYDAAEQQVLLQPAAGGLRNPAHISIDHD